MLSPTTYNQRRQQLCEQLDTGLVLLLGHGDAARNAAGNTYPFRQDSTFLYYFGLHQPHRAALLDIDAGTTCLFGDDPSAEEIVWTGPVAMIAELGDRVGVTATAPRAELIEQIKTAHQQGRAIHLLPTYRSETVLTLQQLFGDTLPEPSAALIKAVVAQRSVKSEEEVAQIEIALDISAQMHSYAMRATQPGLREQEIVNSLASIACLGGLEASFTTIFSVHGETLHNSVYRNLMHEGDIIVHDSGVESDLGYASDITRTFPVSGSFTPEQRDLYGIVLDMQQQAIKAVRPNVPFRDIHRLAATVLMQGLKDLGVTRGNMDDAVDAGAHNLFYPHGLGHMLGLDVHDMEALGENYVGYSDTVKRDERFGWNRLRFARELEPGFVITVEPGLYFIPALIDKWQAENKLADFINYDKVNNLRNARGIRIEDDVLVTPDGNRVLGPSIPKTIVDVEAACQM
ncbi:aminopeptidase P family protein [Planctomycetota bacterium]